MQRSVSIRLVTFREYLAGEFEKRRAANRRYSLRRMALELGADHSTLSQILRGTRPVPASKLRSFGKRLGLTPEEIAVFQAAAGVPDADVRYREEQLQHWSAEAQALLSEPHHYELLRHVHEADFRADARAIADRLGVTLDQVNIAAARLARLGLLEMAAAQWRDSLGLGLGSAAAFRRRALERVRQLAPMFPKKIRRGES